MPLSVIDESASFKTFQYAFTVMTTRASPTSFNDSGDLTEMFYLNHDQQKMLSDS